MTLPTNLEKLRDYLIKHKIFVNVTKSTRDEEVKYWKGYEDAMKAFEDQIEFLLRANQ